MIIHMLLLQYFFLLQRTGIYLVTIEGHVGIVKCAITKHGTDTIHIVSVSAQHESNTVLGLPPQHDGLARAQHD